MNLNDEIHSLSDFIQNLNFGDRHGRATEDSLVLISRGDRTVILVGDDAERYTQMRSSIYEALNERRSTSAPASRRAIEGLVDDFFVHVLRDGDHNQNAGLPEQLQAEVQKLKVALFEKPKNWEIHLAVEGIDPVGLPLTVGGVQFSCLDEASLSALKERTRGIIVGLAVRDSDAVVARMSSNLDVLRGKTIGVLAVNAVDSEAAILAAKRELQITIDAINFFAAREGIGGWLFLPGDAMPQAELVLAICEGESIVPSVRRAGPRLRIPLRQVADRKGFARVSEILGKKTPSSLEQKILASLQWAGRAQVESRREEAFLLYAIALESLLLEKNTKAEISHRLAVRCAHLGGGPTLNDKDLVVDQILSLYNTRSKIVHSGDFLVSEEALRLIRHYCILTIFVVIDVEPFRSMMEVKELEQWFNAQLLSGGVSRT
jgi:hypothetical protein